jgi:2-polyprenyl-6-hydroxyphenyl methylase/3-demethylubiquinone-9 3-methyltransferase
MEHVNNHELFINSLCTMIKVPPHTLRLRTLSRTVISLHLGTQPGGSLFLSTINRTTKSYMQAIVGAEYILGLVPPGTHQWDKFVQPTELQVLLQR